MAVVEHRGRQSGKTYLTPVMAFVEDGGVSVVLNYGTKSDWVRNVESAGSAVWCIAACGTRWPIRLCCRLIHMSCCRPYEQSASLRAARFTGR